MPFVEPGAILKFGIFGENFETRNIYFYDELLQLAKLIHGSSVSFNKPAVRLYH